jgi:hypothetical protein
MGDELVIVRDERGRIKTRSGAVPGGGRLTTSDTAMIRQRLLEAANPGQMNRFLAALGKKLDKGSIDAAEFLFDRILGKPAVSVSHDVDGKLSEFMATWTAMRAAELDGIGDDQKRDVAE